MEEDYEKDEFRDNFSSETSYERESDTPITDSLKESREQNINEMKEEASFIPDMSSITSVSPELSEIDRELEELIKIWNFNIQFFDKRIKNYIILTNSLKLSITDSAIKLTPNIFTDINVSTINKPAENYEPTETITNFEISKNKRLQVDLEVPLPLPPSRLSADRPKFLLSKSCKAKRSRHAGGCNSFGESFSGSL